ncbi:MAG TPA: GGDEF domain-containing protein [Pirellulales bacterium]|nr:GGDEF domain-containing protein [Pirellulales bacterium]
MKSPTALREREYEAILGEVLQRLGMHGKNHADVGNPIAAPNDAMTAVLKDELTERLASIVASNQRLRDDLAAAQEQLRAQRRELDQAKADSRHDSLTQLPNRRAFDERLCELLARCERHGERYVLVLFDIDGFKSFNDTFGHVTGDAILAAIGGVLRDGRRATDHVSRIGGEEFALLLTQTDLQRCPAAIERYRKAIEAATLSVDGRLLRVTASFGAAEMSPGELPDRLIKRADEALYAAKNHGRNCTWLHQGGGVVPL